MDDSKRIVINGKEVSQEEALEIFDSEERVTHLSVEGFGGKLVPNEDAKERTASRVKKTEESLTQEEKDAPIYLDWSNETLGRSVRETANLIGDTYGELSMQVTAALHILTKSTHDSNIGCAQFDISDKRGQHKIICLNMEDKNEAADFLTEIAAKLRTESN